MEPGLLPSATPSTLVVEIVSTNHFTSRHSQTFMTCADLLSFQVCSLLVKVKLTAKNNVVVVLNSTVVHLVQKWSFSDLMDSFDQCQLLTLHHTRSVLWSIHPHHSPIHSFTHSEKTQHQRQDLTTIILVQTC